MRTLPSPQFLFVVLLPLLVMTLAVSAGAGSLIDTKVALHVTGVPSKGVSVCGDHRPTAPCSEYNTQGDLGGVHYVYLVTAQTDSGGVKGLGCGIDYDPVPGQGVDISQWTFCGDGLEFRNSGVNGPWPAAGGGNRMTWVTCQDSEIPPDGVHAVFGAFVAYAYGNDTLAVTDNRNLQSGPLLEVSSCETGVVLLNPALAAGSAVFSSGASDPGFNPCLGGPASCTLDFPNLFFTVTLPGDFEDESFTITNILDSGNLTGDVTLDNCPEFEILSGGGPYDLAPGETKTVVVRFSSATTGTFLCTLDTGSSCPPVNLTGTTTGQCSVTPSSLDLGNVPLGQFEDGFVTISNPAAPGGAFLTGTLSVDCSDFAIIAGGSYNLAPGESQQATIRFTPTSIGLQFCTLDTGSLCGTLRVFGSSGTPSNIPPVIALHNQPVPGGVPDVCDDAPTIPCSQYSVRGGVNEASFVYLVVGKADRVLGIQGISCGIDYDPAPAQGVDVLQWILCSGVTQFPTIPGPHGSWPAAESGNRITWDDCQTNDIPPDDLHAIAGAFYVYAYGSDDLAVTPNNALEEGSPELEALDCFGNDIQLSPSDDLGRVSFSPGGMVAGVNPCLEQINATAAWVAPHTINPGSSGNRITAYVELPVEFDPADVLVETVRIMGSVPADTNLIPDLEDFNENGILDLVVKFDRTLFIDALPVNQDTVEVEITGQIGTVAIFTATDAVTVLHPHLLSPSAGQDLMGGMFAEIAWDLPSGWSSVTATLFYSTDMGVSWIPIKSNIQGTRHIWQAPRETHEAVLIRAEIFDVDGLLGRTDSEVFSITEQVVGIGDPTTLGPGLMQNAPNPFGEGTVIQYALDRESHVTLDVFNIQGQRVRTLVDTRTPAGVHETRWDGLNERGDRLASGIYLYRLNAGSYQETRRMILTH